MASEGNGKASNGSGPATNGKAYPIEDHTYDVVVVLMLIGSNQAGAKQIFSSVPIAIIMLLFIVASAWHMKIGMQVVIEDYVHNEKIKLASVMANNFFCFAVAFASIYAILKMSSGV